MAEDVEVFLEVGVGVGVVGAQAHAGEVEAGGFVEAGGEGVGPGGTTGGVGAPAAGGEPAVATAGGVAVDGDEDDVVFAEEAAPVVDAAAALGQGMPFSSGTRRAASRPRAARAVTMPRAMMRFSRYSSRRPSGERLPRVSAP